MAGISMTRRGRNDRQGWLAKASAGANRLPPVYEYWQSRTSRPQRTPPSHRLLKASIPNRSEHFEHRGNTVEIILPESSEALIDEDEFDADERLPYWAELWPAGRALARALLDDPPTGRVIELGCGVGLPSLVLSRLGMDITATDYYQDALDYTLRNARHNGIDPPATRLLDWRDPPADLGRYELIVGADLLYEARNVDALAPLLAQLVAEHGTVLLTDPDRTQYEPFRERMRETGWTLEELPDRSELSPAGNGIEIRIRILRLSRGPSKP